MLVSFTGVPGGWRRGGGVVAGVLVFAVGVSGLPPAVAGERVEAASSAVVGRVAADSASAVVNARLGGERVEDLSQRTETSSTFALQDGSWQLVSSMSPVWVRTGGDGLSEGDWSAVDADLEVSADGSLRPAVLPGDVVLSGGGDAGSDGVSVVASLTDPDSGAKSEITYPGDLPVPKVSGPRAVYEDVQVGVDMVVDVTGTGVEQYVVVHQAPTNPDALGLEVGVQSDDAKVTTSGPGAVSLVADGEKVASVADPLMWDATYDAQLANPVTKPWDEGEQPQVWAGTAGALDTPSTRTPHPHRSRRALLLDPLI